jgi:hypothetical protein
MERMRERFEQNMRRHEGIRWAEVRERLDKRPEKVRSLEAMERSGGEPDVVGRDRRTGEILFADCAAESPAGRRSLCYDESALAARKQNKPVGSACGMAQAMGVELMTEEEYGALQELEEFDTKTSSWLLTSGPIRAQGGALFGDRRYGAVFTYHNGAESYYAARGFRAMLRV